MEHAPLTDTHKAFLAELEGGPIELSIDEQNSRGLPDLGFLEQAAYVQSVQTYADPDIGKCRYRWTRTAKTYE